MSYLEELLPEFRNGAKIRRKNWPENLCISLRGSCGINIAFYDVNADDWEKVPDNPIDWDYIIKNKCLCWFWDNDDTDGVMAILVSVYKDSPYRYYCRDLAGCGSSRKHCRPVRKDEVTFYEDKRDGNN